MLPSYVECEEDERGKNKEKVEKDGRKLKLCRKMA